MSKDTSPSLVAIATTSKQGTESSLLSDSLHTESKDVMHFVTDATVEQVHYDAPSSIVDLVDSLHIAEEDQHTIEKFLSRPVEIASGSFIPKERGTSYIDLDISTDSLPKVFKEKLAGFYAAHFNLDFKLLVNAQPFESGIVQMVWQPQYSADKSRYELVGIGVNGLPFTTGLPSAYLNFATESDVTLSVPYINTTPYCAFNTMSTIGRISLINFCTVSSGSNSPTVPFTLYLSLSKVKLFGASVPAQGLPTPQKERNEGTKISEIASQVGKIPMLGAIAPEIPMVANTVASVASSLGFSEPQIPYSESMRVKIDPTMGGAHGDGAVANHKFSVFSDCQTSSQPFGLTDEDEMSIQALCRDPQYLETITWRTDQPAGTRISWFRVMPTCYKWDKAPPEDGERDRFYPNRLRYVSQMFNYWRGTIGYQLQMAATKFHSGRLRLCYTPATEKTPSYEDARQYSYNQIVDLRDGSLFSFECPYVNVSAWRNVPFTKSGNAFITNFAEASFTIFVENELRCPDNASSSVEIAIMNYAGSDFELAVPVAGIHAYQQHASSSTFEFGDNGLMTNPDLLDPIYTDPNYQPEGQLEEVAEFKVDVVEQKKKKKRLFHFFKAQGVMNMVTGESKFVKPKDKATELCIGERVISLRPLTRRLEYLGRVGLNENHVYGIFPFFYKFSNSGIDQADPTLFGAIRALFLFYRGGMRFVLNSVDPTSFQVTYTPWYNGTYAANNFAMRKHMFRVDDGQTPIDINHMPKLMSAVGVPVNQSVEGVVDITTPYFSKYQQVLTTYGDQRTFYYHSQFTGVNNGVFPAGIVHFASAKTTDVNVFRAGADDYSLSCMLGAPRCYNDCYVTPDN